MTVKILLKIKLLVHNFQHRLASQFKRTLLVLSNYRHSILEVTVKFVILRSIKARLTGMQNLRRFDEAALLFLQHRICISLPIVEFSSHWYVICVKKVPITFPSLTYRMTVVLLYQFEVSSILVVTNAWLQ